MLSVALASLELTILWSQPPEFCGFQRGAVMTGIFFGSVFLKKSIPLTLHIAYNDLINCKCILCIFH